MVSSPNAGPRFNGGPGKSFLIGGTVVAAGLSGFYLNLLRNKKRQEETGTNPFHEQILASHGRKPSPDEPLATLVHARYSQNPPAFRGDIHHSGHATRENYKNTPEYEEHGDALLYMVPSPQRGRKDGSGKPYTKSPDYVDSYEKVKRVKKDSPQ